MSDEPGDLHPTHLKTAAIFLDILFGVLLGIIVLEFHPDHYLHKLPSQRLFFSVLYAALLLKFFFHWYGIHADTAVLGSFFEYTADVPKYLSGIVVAFTYFVCVKLLVLWFEDPADVTWAMRWFFAVLAGFKLIDTLTNLIAVRRLIGDLIARGKPAWLPKETWTEVVPVLNQLYSTEQPKIVTLFLLAEPFLVVGAASTNLRWWSGCATGFLVIEGSVEKRLSTRRLRIWNVIHGIRARNAFYAATSRS